MDHERPPLARWITQAGLDAYPMPTYAYTREGTLVAGNAAAEAFWKIPNAALINNFNLIESAAQLGPDLVNAFQASVTDSVPRRTEPTLREWDIPADVLNDVSKSSLQNQWAHHTHQARGVPTEGANYLWLQVLFLPLLDAEGALHYVIGQGINVTAEMTRLTEIQRAQQEIATQKTTIEGLERAQHEIERQRATIEEFSSPIIDVWSDVVLVPLIGAISHERANAIVDRLLRAITTRQSRHTIIDLTGVPEIDSGSANHLIQISAMVSLLGAQCVLAGIQPAVAETITALNINLNQKARVFRSVSDALEHCMRA
jgi:anti-anti-sigma factor